MEAQSKAQNAIRAAIGTMLVQHGPEFIAQMNNIAHQNYGLQEEFVKF